MIENTNLKNDMAHAFSRRNMIMPPATVEQAMDAEGVVATEVIIDGEQYGGDRLVLSYAGYAGLNLPAAIAGFNNDEYAVYVTSNKLIGIKLDGIMKITDQLAVTNLPANLDPSFFVRDGEIYTVLKKNSQPYFQCYKLDKTTGTFSSVSTSDFTIGAYLTSYNNSYFVCGNDDIMIFGKYNDGHYKWDILYSTDGTTWEYIVKDTNGIPNGGEYIYLPKEVILTKDVNDFVVSVMGHNSPSTSNTKVTLFQFIVKSDYTMGDWKYRIANDSNVGEQGYNLFIDHDIPKIACTKIGDTSKTYFYKPGTSVLVSDGTIDNVANVYSLICDNDHHVSMIGSSGDQINFDITDGTLHRIKVYGEVD